MMQRIYEPEHLLEGELLLAMLASEGVPARLTGQDLLGGMGCLPVTGLLGIEVDDVQVDRALALISAYNAALPVEGDEPDSYPDVLVC